MLVQTVAMKELTAVFHMGNSFLSKKFIIPYNQNVIADRKFHRNSRLIKVIIPEGITKIGHQTFYQCSRLSSIIIPNSVTIIGQSAFSKCARLVCVNIPSGVSVIEQDAFSDCVKLANVIIPEGVTVIERKAFSRCQSLTSITIPDGVLSIGCGAFFGCTSLKTIVIPESITSIGFMALSECSDLTAIIINTSDETRYNIIKNLLPEEQRVLVADFSISAKARENQQNLLGEAYAACHLLNALPIVNRFNNWVREFHIYDGNALSPLACSVKEALAKVPMPHNEDELKVYRKRLTQLGLSLITVFHLENYNNTLRKKEIPSAFFSSGIRPKQDGNQKILDTYALVSRMIACFKSNSGLELTVKEKALLAEKPKLLSLLPMTVKEQWGIDASLSTALSRVFI